MNKYLLGLAEVIAKSHPDFANPTEIRHYVGGRLGSAVIDFRSSLLTKPELETIIREFNEITSLSVGFDFEKMSFTNAGEEETAVVRESIRRIMREREG